MNFFKLVVFAFAIFLLFFEFWNNPPQNLIISPTAVWIVVMEEETSKSGNNTGFQEPSKIR